MQLAGGSWVPMTGRGDCITKISQAVVLLLCVTSGAAQAASVNSSSDNTTTSEGTASLLLPEIAPAPVSQDLLPALTEQDILNGTLVFIIQLSGGGGNVAAEQAAEFLSYTLETLIPYVNSTDLHLLDYSPVGGPEATTTQSSSGRHLLSSSWENRVQPLEPPEGSIVGEATLAAAHRAAVARLLDWNGALAELAPALEEVPTTGEGAALAQRLWQLQEAQLQKPVQPGLPESPGAHRHTSDSTVEAAQYLGRTAHEQPSRRSLRAAPAGYTPAAVAPPPAVLPAPPSPATWEAPGPVLSKGSANLESAVEEALDALPAYNKTAPKPPEGLPTLNFLYEVDTGNQAYVDTVHLALTQVIVNGTLSSTLRTSRLGPQVSAYLLAFQPGFGVSSYVAAPSAEATATPAPGPSAVKSYPAVPASSAGNSKVETYTLGIIFPLVFLGLVAFGIVAYRRVALRLRVARQIEELSRQRRDGAPFGAAGDLEAGKSSKWGSRDQLYAIGDGLSSARNSRLTQGTLSPSSSGGGDLQRHSSRDDSPRRIGESTWLNDLPRIGSDWEIGPEDLTICTRPDGRQWLLGTGAFSTVYKGLLQGVQVVAVKKFRQPDQIHGSGGSQRSAAQMQKRELLIKQEIAVLKACRDRNIVQFVGACIQPTETLLVTEYLEGGDLFQALACESEGKLSWYRHNPKGPGRQLGLGRRIAIDIAKGLHFLHSRKIVHFDMKSANVLLARGYTAKIADVGLAKILHHEFLSTMAAVGTFFWCAPEVLLGRPNCTEKVDIYSYGVVLWEICTGEPPCSRALRPLRVPEECPQSVATIVSDCVDEDPDRRPTAREVVERLMRIREGPGRQPAAIQEGSEPLTEGLTEAASAQQEAAAGAEAGTEASPAAAGGEGTDAAPGDPPPAAAAEAEPGGSGPGGQGAVPFASIWRAQLSQHQTPGADQAPAGKRRSSSNSFTRHRRTMSLPAHDSTQGDQEAEQAPESQVPVSDATSAGAEPPAVAESDQPAEAAMASEHQAVPGSRSSQESLAPQSPHPPAEPQYQRPPRPAYMISPALMHNISFAFPSVEPTASNHSQESLDSHHESATGYH